MPLAPLYFLAAVVAAFRPSDLGGLHRLTINARRARRGLPSGFPANPLSQPRQDLGPCPVIAPLGKIVVHTAFGKQIMRQHVPLAATAVQIQERVEYLTHVDFPGPAPLVAAGSWNQRLHDRPLCIREIRWIRLPLFLFPQHPRALLFLLRFAPPFYHTFCQPQFPESLSLP